MTHTAWVESSLAILLNVTAGKTLGKCVKTRLLSLVAGEHARFSSYQVKMKISQDHNRMTE